MERVVLVGEHRPTPLQDALGERHLMVGRERKEEEDVGGGGINLQVHISIAKHSNTTHLAESLLIPLCHSHGEDLRDNTLLQEQTPL